MMADNGTTVPATAEDEDTLGSTQQEQTVDESKLDDLASKLTTDDSTVRSAVPELSNTIEISGPEHDTEPTIKQGSMSEETTEVPPPTDAPPPTAGTVTDIQTSSDKEPTATVKFVLTSGDVITLASMLNSSVASLLDQVANKIKVDSAVLKISRNGEEVEQTNTLVDLNVEQNGTIQFEITSIDPVNSPIKPIKQQPTLGMPDVITVRILNENNECNDIVVEIERQVARKTFLGGFRHKLTGQEFHHAAAQTQRKGGRPPTTVARFNRDAQTVFEANKIQQTYNTTSTQMTKIGCYISTNQDKLLTPGKYMSYDEYMERRIKAVIRLQAYFRRWQARDLVNELKNDRDKRVVWEQSEEIKKRREKEWRIEKEFERRMNPKTREDFDLLYAALEKWRLEELSHIDAELTGAERKAALCALLEQETQLIASIDRRKIDAGKTGKEESIIKLLDQAAAPKRWKAYDGDYIEMDTRYTIRAKELRDIYTSINMKYLTQDERLDVLLTLKHTIKEHDCKLTREIIELIDREADLLMRGVKETNLEGLRKRISTLFLQYCKTPLFNPEIARLLKVPQDASTLRKDIYFCPSANQYLPSTEFQISSNSRVVGKCRKVQQLDNEARTRNDYSYYKVMLRTMRRSEENYPDDSKIVFLVQEKDLQYLIENIWGCQSILSAWDDLFDLCMVRWDKDEEWSPWNTILLTKDEAIAHGRLDHLDEAYSKQFIAKVKNKHTLARVHFVKIPGMAELLRAKTTGSQRLPGPGHLQGTSALSAY